MCTLRPTRWSLPGCRMSAIKAAFESCTKEGDTIAISSPCFNGILELLGKMSRKITDPLRWRCNLQQLETHLKSKRPSCRYLLYSHMNPQGINMFASQQKLAALVNEYRVPIIEDDVYLELLILRTLHCLPNTMTKVVMLWCGSVSKSLSPSYRLGWCLPGRYINEYKVQFSKVSYGAFHHSIKLSLTLLNLVNTQTRRRRCSQILSLRQQYLNYLTQHLPPGCKDWQTFCQGGAGTLATDSNLNQPIFCRGC